MKTLVRASFVYNIVCFPKIRRWLTNLQSSLFPVIPSIISWLVGWLSTMPRELTQEVKASQNDFTYSPIHEEVLQGFALQTTKGAKRSGGYFHLKKSWIGKKNSVKYFELKRSCSRIKCRVERNFINICPIQIVFGKDSCKLGLACWFYWEQVVCIFVC